MKINKILLLYILLVFNSCSFYSFKGSLPAHIDNINISPIINNSTEYSAVEILDKEIYDTLLKENVLKLVNIENAKSRLDITIQDITDKAYTYDMNSSSSFEQVQEWRITIKAQVVWFDIKENEPLFSKEMTSFGIYNSSSSNDISTDNIDNDQDGLIDLEDNDEFGPPRYSAIQIASKKLSENIVADITSTW